MAGTIGRTIAHGLPTIVGQADLFGPTHNFPHSPPIPFHQLAWKCVQMHGNDLDTFKKRPILNVELVSFKVLGVSNPGHGGSQGRKIGGTVFVP